MFLETSMVVLNTDRVLYFSVEDFIDGDCKKKYAISAHYKPEEPDVWMSGEYDTREEAKRALHNLAADIGALETEV